MTVAILGTGQMGSVLVASLLRKGTVTANRLRSTVKHSARATEMSKKLGIQVTTDNVTAVRGAHLVFICVKPQHIAELLAEIRGAVSPEAAVISIATAVTTDSIERILGEHRVVRAMPNTACRVGAGMTALCRGRHADAVAMRDAEMIFAAMGRTVEVDEALMNAATGLSASGPAFVYIILEALAEGGVRAGLPRDVSMLLATQATLGAATMVLETGQHPAMLKEEVTTPAGCTIDGILELEAGGIRATLIRAISVAAEKARLMTPPALGPNVLPPGSSARTA
jgi:pyrroline-5-carboxylate reductase